MRKSIKVLFLLIAMSVVFSMLTVSVSAATITPGFKQVFKATDGNTRNPAWMNAETGIISIPLGADEFASGANHGAYHYYTPVAVDDTYFVHWVVKVPETPDAAEQVILSEDPWYLTSYEAKGEGEVASGETAIEGMTDDFPSEVYYEDITPGKWVVINCGFTVMSEESKFVQHRLNFKNIAPMDIKYLVVTDSSVKSLTCDPATGEINGYTNNKPADPTTTATATQKPSEQVTTAPTQAATTEAPAQVTTAAPSQAATEDVTPTAAPASGDNETEGPNIVLIIVVAAVIVAAGAVAAFLIIKKNKRKA